MAQPSVLLIGASGNFGTPLVQEFLKQKSKFHRIAILAEQHRVQKFAQAQKDGIEIVVGSFLDVNSYRGTGNQRRQALTNIADKSHD